MLFVRNFRGKENIVVSRLFRKIAKLNSAKIKEFSNREIRVKKHFSPVKIEKKGET